MHWVPCQSSPIYVNHILRIFSNGKWEPNRKSHQKKKIYTASKRLVQRRRKVSQTDQRKEVEPVSERKRKWTDNLGPLALGYQLRKIAESNGINRKPAKYITSDICLDVKRYTETFMMKNYWNRQISVFSILAGSIGCYTPETCDTLQGSETSVATSVSGTKLPEKDFFSFQFSSIENKTAHSGAKN